MKGKKIKRTILAVTVLCVGLLTGCGTDKKTEEQQLALRTQGMEQAREGSYEDAIASYNEALGLADMRAGSLELDIAAYKASAQYHAGNTEDAIATCSAILDLKESAEIYTTRGLLYREAGNAEAAKADFTKAMSLTSKKNKVMLGRLSYYMEDYTNAKTYLEAASKEGNPEGIYWQAELYREMGNTDYAITLYQSYLDGEEVTHQEAYERVAAYQLAQGDYTGALDTLQAGISMGNGGCLQKLMASEITVYEQQGNFDTALQKMESYLESYPDDADAQREYTFLKTRSQDGQAGTDTEAEEGAEGSEE